MSSAAFNLNQKKTRRVLGRVTGLVLFLLFLIPLFFLPAPNLIDDPAAGVIAERYGDYPVIAIDVQYAHQALLTTGPYSRFMFHHPSPVLAYWYAAVESVGIFGTGYPAYEIAQAIWNLLWLFAAGLAITVLSGTVASAVLLNATVFAVLPLARVTWLTDIWGPATPIIPLLALILLCASSIYANRRFFLLSSAAGAATIASHIGALPIVFALWCICATYFFKRASKIQFRSVLIPLTIIFLLFFGLPLIEVIFSADYGNLSRFVRFLGRPRPALGFVGALTFFDQYFTGVFLRSLFGNYLFWLVGAGGVAIIVAAVERTDKSELGNKLYPPSRILLLMSTIAALGVLFAASRIVAKPQEYLIWTVWSVVLAFVAVIIVAVLRYKIFKSAVAQSLVVTLGLALLLFNVTPLVREGNQAFEASKIISFLRTLPQPIEVRPGGKGEWDAVAMVLRASQIANRAVLVENDKLLLCVPARWVFMYREFFKCNEPAKSIAKVWRTQKMPADIISPATNLFARTELVTVVAVEPASLTD